MFAISHAYACKRAVGVGTWQHGLKKSIYISVVLLCFQLDAFVLASILIDRRSIVEAKCTVGLIGRDRKRG